MKILKIFFVFITLILTLTITSCAGGGGSSQNAELQSIQISNNISSTLVPNMKIQYSAIGVYSNGTAKDITSTVQWSSSNTNIANIQQNGLLSTLAAGNTSVTAKLNDITSNTSTLVIVNGNLQSLTILSNTTSANIALGSDIAFTATENYSDGSTSFNVDLTNSVSWVSSNSTVLSINTQGIATANSVGSANVSASFQSVQSSNSYNYTVINATLQSINISSDSGSVSVGGSAQLTATGIYFDGVNTFSQDITNSVTWNSSNQSVISISNIGLAIALKEGTSNITAALKGIMSNQAAITVTTNVYNFQVNVPSEVTLPGSVVLSASLGNNSSATVNFTLPSNYTVISVNYSRYQQALNSTSLNSQVSNSLESNLLQDSSSNAVCNLDTVNQSCSILIAVNNNNSGNISYAAVITPISGDNITVNDTQTPNIVKATKSWQYLGGQSFMRTYNYYTRPQLAVTNNQLYLGLNNVNGAQNINLYYLNNNSWTPISTQSYPLQHGNNYLIGRYSAYNFQYILGVGSNAYVLLPAINDSGVDGLNTYSLTTSGTNQISFITSGIPESAVNTSPVYSTSQTGLYNINNQASVVASSPESCAYSSSWNCLYKGTSIYNINGVVQNYTNSPNTSQSSNETLTISSYLNNIYLLNTKNQPNLLSNSTLGNGVFNIINSQIYYWALYTDSYITTAWNNLLFYSVQSGGSSNILVYNQNSNTWNYMPSVSSTSIQYGLYSCGNTLYIFGYYGTVNTPSYYTSLMSYDLTQGLSGSWQIVGGYGFSSGLNYSLSFDSQCNPYIAYLDSKDFSSVSVVAYK